MKIIKKIIVTTLLSLSLAVTFIPIDVFAINTVDKWDGTVDTSWYDNHENDSEYHITTAKQLAGIAKLVNDKTVSESFKGKTIYLDNDLDLAGYEWTSIGNGSNFARYFAGTFNGQYHIINHLSHHTSENDFRNGLFGIVSSGGIIKNLQVINADIVSNDDSLIAGVLADWVNAGTVENCYTSGKIENNNGHKFLGGLIGQCTADTQIKGCASDTNVVSTFSGDDCDTVGGLIGQWETSKAASLITDCWFGGSVSCNNINSAVAGILGANFDFRGPSGVIIRNCMVSTKNITCAEPGNITWITAAATVLVKNCIWPDTPPADVTLDEETYPDNNGNYFAVVRLIVDWNAGTASADPNFDQSKCGKSVSNFTLANVLTELQENASEGIKWVCGINHPTFSWNELNILADYTKVNEAKSKIPNDLSIYTDESVKSLKDILASIEEEKNLMEQEIVDGYAMNIENAIKELKYKDADYTKVNKARAKVPSDLNIYTDESIKSLKDILASIEEGKNITEQATVDGYADAITKAISELKYRLADYTKVNEAKSKVPNDLSIYTDESVETLKNALNAVKYDKNITEQDIVDEYAMNINKALEKLKKKEITSIDKTQRKQIKTGDSTNFIGLAGLMILSIFGYIILKKKTLDR
ncbi:LPXTG cell wall anchor domain-containing protein [Faecalibacillus intestinalis]|uniref:LPXTG cell wall anchor domain-containing protein n=1 Tax=Faecalibacillus intestinalis TaxID=1982626 RepID=UPI003AB55B72